jgi:hypothetical protein
LQLPTLKNISIPRLVKIKGEVTTIWIHGFSGASERAFGACVYKRSGNTNGKLHSQLLCSKSKVSPVKQVSFPGLELCGAQLLARLIKVLPRILILDPTSVSLLIKLLVTCPSASSKVFSSSIDDRLFLWIPHSVISIFKNLPLLNSCRSCIKSTNHIVVQVVSFLFHSDAVNL